MDSKNCEYVEDYKKNIEKKFDRKTANFRVYVREFNDNDIEALTECANDINVSKGVNSNLLPYPFKRENAEIIIKRSELGIEKHYGIFLKNEDKLIGGLVIFNLNEESAEIGYWINSKYIGRSYAKEAVIILIDICFGVFFVNKIYARILSTNEASIKLIKSLNFKEVGFENKSGKMEYIFSLSKYN
ncbi:MAG: GNAT family N-acetyltransferase [Candidatus Micrarchaeia archaeon]